MTALDLDGIGQPMDPKLIMAIESAFNAVSFTGVPFVPAPRIFAESNRKGSVKGPARDKKADIKLQLVTCHGARCAYCDREFIDLDDATLDHVIPNSVVGHWEPWNLVLACNPCNNLKGDMVPLALMPLLCSLLAAAHRFPYNPVATERRAEAKSRWSVVKMEKRRRRAAARQQRIVERLEALSGQPFRLALEAAPAQPAGSDGGR